MRYIVQENHFNLEFGFRLFEGHVVDDATTLIEPDLITSLVSAGVLRDENTPVTPEWTAQPQRTVQSQSVNQSQSTKRNRGG